MVTQSNLGLCFLLAKYHRARRNKTYVEEIGTLAPPSLGLTPLQTIDTHCEMLHFYFTAF
jgi:hypothetical protein